jgi:hypothetical protein
MLSMTHNLCLTDGSNIIFTKRLITDFKRLAVQVFVLEEYHDFLGPDCCLEKSFIILGIIGSKGDEPGNVGKP